MKISEIKPNIHKQVIYCGAEYYFLECVMWLDENRHEFEYSAILIDKNKNSVLRAPIEKVEVITNDIYGQASEIRGGEEETSE